MRSTNSLLAALVAVCASIVLPLPAPALAATCDHSAHPAAAFWTTCLTIGRAYRGWGYGEGIGGRLDSRTGSYGDETFTITDFSGKPSWFYIDFVEEHVFPEARDWVLQIGSERYVLSEADDIDDVLFYMFEFDSGPSWSADSIGDVVAVSLSDAVPAPPVAAPLTGFSVVDVSTGDLAGTLSDTGTLTVAAGGLYGIRADVDPDAHIGSVTLALTGAKTVSRTENLAPWSLYGDRVDGGARVLHGASLPAGAYTLTATAYDRPAGAGDLLHTLSMSFTVAHDAAPVTPPDAGVLTGLSLIDAADQSLVTALTDGAALDLDARPGASLAVRADVADDATVGSVTFSLAGPRSRRATENIAPYSLYGDAGPGALHGRPLPAGSYTLVATAYAGRRGAGVVIGTRSISFDVLGPSSLSVDDASAAEAADATLDFLVSLSRPSTATVTVAYASADGTATVAGGDYIAVSGTLTFAPGDDEKTVSVPVLVDDVDEGAETLTLRLSTPTGATLSDAEATGTITNDGLLPGAWVARFGRTVTGQVVDAVAARLAARRAPGAEGTLAGRSLSAGARPHRPLSFDDPSMGPEPTARTLSTQDLLAGSAFSLTGASAPDTGSAALWGRASVAAFDAREDGLSLDGEVSTGLLGGDWTSPSRAALAGVALGHSRGLGAWRRGEGCAPHCAGRLEAHLTGLYPYAGVDVTERVSLWASAGWGAGTLTVRPEDAPSLSTDLSMSMAALGARGALGAPSGPHEFSLDLVTDARLTHTASEAVRGPRGHLAASDTDVWALRAGLEGARPLALRPQGAVLTPSFTAAWRRDGGDAERGSGADVGAGLAFSDPGSGFSFDARARTLLAHEASGMREWGASLSGAWDPAPATERGFALRAGHTWGASPAGATDALLGADVLAALTSDAEAPESALSQRFEAALGYGLPVFGGAFTGTPHAGVALWGAGARDWHLGWRLARERVRAAALALDVGAVWHEPVAAPPEARVRVGVALRW